MRGPGPSFVGILGWPLDHTLSPALHNVAFKSMKLDWVYLSWPVEPENLAAAVSGLKVLGAMGANVTMPHKEAIVPLLDDISGDAKLTGAVNTIQRIGERLIGHNTDIDGFKQFLAADAGVDFSGCDALVLGAGERRARWSAPWWTSTSRRSRSPPDGASAPSLSRLSLHRASCVSSTGTRPRRPVGPLTSWSTRRRWGWPTRTSSRRPSCTRGRP